MNADTYVAVVGAGVAGLACAAAIRQAGRRCELLEAAPRIGGRAWTTHPPSLRGAAFDHGASWLHAAERNPLREIAEAAGDPLLATDGAWSRRVVIEGRPASAEELDDFERAQHAYERLIEARAAADAPDCSMAAAADPMADDPWLATVESFESTLIAAADARDCSVRDAAANALDGANLNVVGGLGAFVARRLHQQARLGTRVRSIAWNAGGVTLETDRGTLRAAGCAVTVSTGVLRAGGIAFSPALPESWRAALDGLPMGALTKVAFGAAPGQRFGLPPTCFLRGRLARRHEAAFSFIAFPFGEPHLVGFIGGDNAASLSREGLAATEAFARDELARLLGRAAADSLSPGIVADWSSDPLHLGAYAYARPGHADARARLAAPLDEGRLVLAGEATADAGLAGTVGGAWRSGARAAQVLLASIG